MEEHGAEARLSRYSTDESPEALVITFDGVNQAKADEAELALFKRRLAEPSKSSTSSDVPPGFGWVLGYAAFFFGLFIASALGLTAMSAAFTFGAIVAFIGLLAIVQWARRRPTRAAPLTKDRFTLRMTSNELTCSAKTMTPITIPLARIAEVAATGRTLTVVMNDASTLRLPCRLAEDPLADHPALAAELNTKLRSLRAASSDYRGVRVALDERTEEGDISPESVEERTSRKQ